MKTNDSILVQHVLSNRSNAMVWAVYVQSEEQEQFKNFCKPLSKQKQYSLFTTVEWYRHQHSFDAS